MGFWWFGRKAAPPDMRPFVPAWLTTAEAEEGFARSIEGMSFYVRSAAVWAAEARRLIRPPPIFRSAQRHRPLTPLRRSSFFLGIIIRHSR